MKKLKFLLIFAICIIFALKADTVNAASKVPNLKVLKITEFYTNGQTGFKIKIKNSSSSPVKIKEFALSEAVCGYDPDLDWVTAGGSISYIYRLKNTVTINAGATKTITWKAASSFGEFNPFDAGNVDCCRNVNIEDLMDEFQITHGRYYNTNIDIVSTFKGRKCITAFDACKTKNLEKLSNEVLNDTAGLYYEYKYIVEDLPDRILVGR